MTESRLRLGVWALLIASLIGLSFWLAMRSQSSLLQAARDEGNELRAQLAASDAIVAELRRGLEDLQNATTIQSQPPKQAQPPKASSFDETALLQRLNPIFSYELSNSGRMYICLKLRNRARNCAVGEK